MKQENDVQKYVRGKIRGRKQRKRRRKGKGKNTNMKDEKKKPLHRKKTDKMDGNDEKRKWEKKRKAMRGCTTDWQRTK